MKKSILKTLFKIEKFIVDEYKSDNDEGLLIPDYNARQIHDEIIDLISLLSEENNDQEKMMQSKIAYIISEELQYGTYDDAAQAILKLLEEDLILAKRYRKLQ